ncbi:MAG: YesL family protein [Anaerolineae bacterium]|nr:YesL family protein [Anaerolineae bacterium]
MSEALKVIGRSFRDWWDEMFLMVGVNLVWGLLALALVTLFPGSMGAYYLTRQKALGHRVEFDMFWAGLRQYFGKAWALGAINVVVTFLLLFNIWFYSNITNWLAYLTLLWIYALVMWLGVIIYVFPMALAQESGGIRTTYRNAAVLAFGRPLFTLVIGIISLLLLALSLVVPPLLLLVYIPLAALVGNHATISSLDHMQRRILEREARDRDAGKREDAERERRG